MLKPKPRQKPGNWRVDSTGFEPALHVCQERSATITLRVRATKILYNKKDPLSRDPFVDKRVLLPVVLGTPFYAVSIAQLYILSIAGYSQAKFQIIFQFCSAQIPH